MDSLQHIVSHNLNVNVNLPSQCTDSNPQQTGSGASEEPRITRPGVIDSFTLKLVNITGAKILAVLNESETDDLFKLSQLEPNHIDHLIDEGFDLHQIALWVGQGLASLSKEEADERNFKVKDKYGRWVSSSGLYFPFSSDFGQLRLDTPIERENGNTAKYLSPLGAKSEARLPKGCQIITEGAKDAAAGSLLGGIPTGALAGVSHYRKALPRNSGYTILFDSDGWANPAVFLNLFNSGKWLSGKIQLVPKIEGHPKAGLCEFFNAGHTAADYKRLIESASKPEALLIEWGNHFGDIPEKRISHAIKVAMRLAAEYLNEIEQDLLLSNIKATCRKVAAKTLSAELDKQRESVSKFKKKVRQKEAEGFGSEHPEEFYRPICRAKNLEFDHCVTNQTFDGWVFREEFAANEGDWRVIDAAFYQWIEKLGYWQHQPDNYINAQIADSGEKAYKLKYSKEFGWQVLKPYELNAHKESAFKYCRSRLDRPGDLPVNVHLRAFKNCVVDLRTGARMPHNKEYFLTSIIPYSYEPGRACPEVFRKFIEDSFGEDMLPIIRAFTSMFLDPTAPYGRFPHLIGQSGGGKGTLGRFWNSLFGEDGASSGDFSNLSTAEARHQYLTGKSIFAVPDAGGYVSGLRAFYELVDNGGMSGRALFNPVGYFKSWNCRFWIASVDCLQIENAGDGWARRAYPIPVRPRTIKPDPDLRLKLEGCKADVISWALAMPREERDRILLSPPENERVINLSLDSALYGDSTKSFVDLCLRPGSEAGFVPSHQLHSWYVSYCQQHGYTPLGMSKFISHLKTVLPRNFAERGWSPMVSGKRSKIAAHWEYLVSIEGAFVKSDVQLQSDAFRPPTPSGNPTWICIKAACEEGGLIEFEDFWNPPPPPPGNSDNNGWRGIPPLSPLPPAEPAKSGTDGRGGTDFAESLERRNSGGVRGGPGGQGIGSDKEKNAVCVLEKKENSISVSSISEGGHPPSTPDSYKVTQSEAKNEAITCSTAQLKLCDNQKTKNKPLTLPLIIKILEAVQTLEELEDLENRASEQGFDEKIWKPMVWHHLTEDTQDWLRVLDSRRKPASNSNLHFCLNALSALEMPGHPAISCEDELPHLWREIESRAQNCELPGDFWNRVSAACGLVTESLAKQKAPIGERCLIQRMGGTLLNPVVEWIGATMVSVPNPPTQTNWIFELADGRRVAVAGEDEWRLADG